MGKESALRIAAIRRTNKSIHKQVCELQKEGEMSNERAKHTPGPWEVVEVYHEVRNIRIETKTDFVCDMGLDNYLDKDVGVLEANARLIAAAPELLEAARELCLVPVKREHDWAWTDLQAAIAKAEGRE